MSMLDKIKSKLKGHEEQTGRAVDKAGDHVDKRTRGKYSGQVDTGQQRIRDEFGSDPKQDPPTRT
ncbi:antitoxin [Streptomyces sp. NPDC050856]|uniref:antitoxin n=1 Tax=unclassified Streptomyces TaxID=2593676 RepID=UPI0033E10B5A